MKTSAELFFQHIKGKKIGFIGVGRSHKDIITMFAKKGAIVSVRDKSPREKIAQSDEFEGLGIKLILGEGYLDDMYEDIVFRTPGVDFFDPAIQKAIDNGVIVTSELEVFFELCPCKTYAITGSDGKTTTTTLISEMLKASGKKVFLGGNIGLPLLCHIEQITEDDVAVVELSSFQLMSMRCRPDVSVITNISPNHLNVHKTMQAYIDAKKNIFIHQTALTKTVFNADDSTLSSYNKEVRGKLMHFSRKSTPKCGTYLDKDGFIHVVDFGKDVIIMNKSDIRIPGMHNVENYLAAISAVSGDVSVENIVWVAKNFGGVEHRIEFVAEKHGVKWYNDSIATSPTRTIAGLNSFDRKIIVIAGGYDKQIAFDPLAPVLCERAKLLILTGDTADKIKTAVCSCKNYDSNALPIIFAKDIPHAVNIAKERATSGDIVSLSPACASFDAYPDFEARGRHFKQLVNEIL